MPSVRLEFSNLSKAQIYARDKAICCFCGTDLWIFRHGISPFTRADWADHVKPASKGGDNSLENGITACIACNSKKNDNTRDRAYFYSCGLPTNDYFLRFDKTNPVVASIARANADIHWVDWFFNRAISNFQEAVLQVWFEKSGGPRYKRGAEYWLNAGFRYVQDWNRHRLREGITHPDKRGLFPVTLAPDQELILKLFDSPSVDQALNIVERLVPHYVGYQLFHDIKINALTDGEFGNLVLRLFENANRYDEAFELLAQHPMTRHHQFAEDLVTDGLAQIADNHLCPNILESWAPLPADKVKELLADLKADSATSIHP